jgi:hypothetical protein
MLRISDLSGGSIDQPWPWDLPPPFPQNSSGPTKLPMTDKTPSKLRSVVLTSLQIMMRADGECIVQASFGVRSQVR